MLQYTTHQYIRESYHRSRRRTANLADKLFRGSSLAHRCYTTAGKPAWQSPSSTSRCLWDTCKQGSWMP